MRCPVERLNSTGSESLPATSNQKSQLRQINFLCINSLVSNVEATQSANAALYHLMMRPHSILSVARHHINWMQKMPRTKAWVLG